MSKDELIECLSEGLTLASDSGYSYSARQDAWYTRWLPGAWSPGMQPSRQSWMVKHMLRVVKQYEEAL